MSQTEFLAQVLAGVNALPEERRNRIFLCKAKLDTLVHESGEDGRIALVLSGLEGAAKAGQGELISKVMEEI